MADNSGAVDLGTSQAEEEPQADAAEPEGTYPGDQNPEDNKPKFLTAFGVLVDYTGNPQIVRFPGAGEEFYVQVQPTSDLVFAAASTIVKDLSSQETAQHTAQLVIAGLQQQAQQAFAAADTQKIREQLGL